MAGLPMVFQNDASINMSGARLPSVSATTFSFQEIIAYKIRDDLVYFYMNIRVSDLAADYGSTSGSTDLVTNLPFTFTESHLSVGQATTGSLTTSAVGNFPIGFTGSKIQLSYSQIKASQRGNLYISGIAKVSFT